MMPKKGKENESRNGGGNFDYLREQLPFLALPDDAKKPEVVKECRGPDVDDVMSFLESMAPSKVKENVKERPRRSLTLSRSRSRSDSREKKRKKKKRKKSRSGSRDRYRNRSRSRERKRSRSRDRKRRRSRSSSRDRKKLEEQRKLLAKKEMAEGPELFRVYTGKVQNITNFGCFVALEGFR